jgi:hypothetical protein
MAVAAAFVIAIVCLYIIFEHVLSPIFKESDQSHAEAFAAKRFSTLQSLRGPLMVYLKNGTKFAAYEVVDVVPGIHEGHDDFVIFVTVSGKQKYARFNTIYLVEEQEDQTKK